MLKLERIEITEEHKAKWGGYNDAPSGWSKITLRNLIQNTHFDQIDPDFLEHRQILYVNGKKLNKVLEVKLFYYWDGTGVGISCDYWGGKMTYYRFGCRHDYHEISQDECLRRGIFHGGNCYHVSVCSKCGHINAVDSSD